ncbi:MAG TPA: DivIVA domain-containing protein [Actinomycetota bacterium]|nr:DivIVA domain-containing protein [Actinomycetota bacterium]
MGKKDRQTGEASAAPSSRLTPMDIQQKEFRVSRFGGYKMRDVDEFLDQITDTFSAMSADIERLRAGGAAPVVGSPDLDDVSRQADEIIARARAEATRIAAEARAGAGALAAAAGPKDRTAVNAFIVREREFLQSLAGLVQEHAETVKDMARSSRRPPTTAAAGESATATATSDAATAPETAVSQAAAKSRSVPEEASEQPAGDTPVERASDGEDTVRIEEPATAGARADGESEGDRSLRDLFWGED